MALVGLICRMFRYMLSAEGLAVCAGPGLGVCRSSAPCMLQGVVDDTVVPHLVVDNAILTLPYT
jgi:hypothetical protein